MIWLTWARLMATGRGIFNDWEFWSSVQCCKLYWLINLISPFCPPLAENTGCCKKKRYSQEQYISSWSIFKRLSVQRKEKGFVRLLNSSCSYAGSENHRNTNWWNRPSPLHLSFSRQKGLEIRNWKKNNSHWWGYKSTQIYGLNQPGYQGLISFPSFATTLGLSHLTSPHI